MRVLLWCPEKILEGLYQQTWAGGRLVGQEGGMLSLGNTWRFPTGSWAALANRHKPSSTLRWLCSPDQRHSVLCFLSWLKPGLPKAPQGRTPMSVAPQGSLPYLSVEWRASPSPNTIPLLFPLLLLLKVLYCQQTLKIWSAKMERKIRI